MSEDIEYGFTDDDIYTLSAAAVNKFVDKLDFPYNFIQKNNHLLMTGTMLLGKIIGILPFVPWLIVFMPTVVAYLIQIYMLDAVYDITKEGTENARIQKTSSEIAAENNKTDDNGDNIVPAQTLSKDAGGTDDIDKPGTE